MPATLTDTRRADATPEVHRVTIPTTRVPADIDGGGSGRPGGDGEGPGPNSGWPLWLAATIITIVAAVLTALGMFSQVLANLAGSQLPGA